METGAMYGPPPSYFSEDFDGVDLPVVALLGQLHLSKRPAANGLQELKISN
jgi:hypothetical protein